MRSILGWFCALVLLSGCGATPPGRDAPAPTDERQSVIAAVRKVLPVARSAVRADESDVQGTWLRCTMGQGYRYTVRGGFTGAKGDARAQARAMIAALTDAGFEAGSNPQTTPLTVGTLVDGVDILIQYGGSADGAPGWNFAVLRECLDLTTDPTPAVDSIAAESK